MSASQAESIEVYLNEGLELFGLGRIEAAIERWRLVLAIVPTEPRALDYLSAAGIDPSVPESIVEFAAADVTAPIEILDVGFYRRRVAALVGEKNYEQALAVLTEARRLDPGDESLSRSMSLLKQHLEARYRARLGRLETSVGRTRPQCPTVCDPRLWILFDGITTVADIIELSPIGEFRTLRSLCLLLESGAVELGKSVSAVAASDSSPTPTTPTTDQSQAAPSPSAADNEYNNLFRNASMAYLRRAHQTATELFEQCLALRPSDRRVIHNLEALRKRSSK